MFDLTIYLFYLWIFIRCVIYIIYICKHANFICKYIIYIYLLYIYHIYVLYICMLYYIYYVYQIVLYQIILYDIILFIYMYIYMQILYVNTWYIYIPIIHISYIRIIYILCFIKLLYIRLYYMTLYYIYILCIIYYIVHIHPLISIQNPSWSIGISTSVCFDLYYRPGNPLKQWLRSGSFNGKLRSLEYPYNYDCGFIRL